MTLGAFKAIVDDVADTAYWIDLYDRGEPTLNESLPEMIAYASSKGVATRLASNLNRLKPDWDRQIVAAGLDQLVVAVDGATQPSYEQYRVGGSLQSVLANIESIVRAKRDMRRRNPHIIVRALITKHNEGELEEIKRLARSVGADNVLLFPIYVDATKADVAGDWLPVNKDYRWYGEDGLRADLPTGRNIVCRELWQRGTITWDGQVFPCCYIDDNRHSLGNVMDSPFTAIWLGQTYQTARLAFSRNGAGFSAVAVDHPTICNSCLGKLKEK